MKKTSCLFLVILGSFLMSVSSCFNKTDPDVNHLNDQIVAQWESESDSMLADSGIPGMIIGIWAPDRNLV